MAWTPTSPRGSEACRGSAEIDALAALLALGIALGALLPSVSLASSAARGALDRAASFQAAANADAAPLLGP